MEGASAPKLTRPNGTSGGWLLQSGSPGQNRSRPRAWSSRANVHRAAGLRTDATARAQRSQGASPLGSTLSVVVDLGRAPGARNGT